MRSLSTVRDRDLLYITAALIVATPCLAQTLENRIEREDEHGLKYTLTLDKHEYWLKELVNLEYLITNTNDTTISIRFPAIQQFNFGVYEGNELIYSDVKIVSEALSFLGINPHETTTFKRIG